MPRADFIEGASLLELLEEERVQFANAPFIEKLKNYKAGGAKIYIVSDFHMDAEKIGGFLGGVSVPAGLFDGIFVSCDFGKSKASGELYGCVLEKLGAKPQECLMIGDSKKSDIDNAAARGLQTLYIPNIKAHLKNSISRRMPSARLRAMEINSWLKNLYSDKYPFSEYILLFFIAAEKLYFSARKDGMENVIFFSREGYFFKKLFDAYQELRVPKAAHLKTFYLRISRKAVNKVCYSPFDARFDGEMSAADFISGAGVPEGEAERIIGEDFRKPFKSFFSSPVFRRIKESPEIAGKCMEMFELNRAAFAKYIGGGPSGKTLYFDVGWNGSMQMLLNMFAARRCQGAYLGLRIDGSYRSNPDWLKDKRQGLLFSNYPQKTAFFDFFTVNTQLYEMLLEAPHGGAVRYAEKGGSVEIIDEWPDFEKKFYLGTIEPWQENAMENFIKICKSFSALDGSGDYKTLGIFISKKSLFHNAAHEDFLKLLDKSFFWNLGKNSRGTKYRIKIGKDLLWQLFVSPERWLRYAVKLRLVVKRGGGAKLLADLAILLFWVYARSHYCVRRVLGLA